MMNSATTTNMFKYSIGVGNNSDLVRRVMRSREHWVEYVAAAGEVVAVSSNGVSSNPVQPVTSSSHQVNMIPSQSQYNFRWSQTNTGVKYEKLGAPMKQCVNHFEEHREISEKD